MHNIIIIETVIIHVNPEPPQRPRTQWRRWVLAAAVALARLATVLHDQG